MTDRSETQLVMGLTRLQSRIQKHLGAVLSPHGISFTEYLVLAQLESAPDQKMRRIDLADKVGLSASGITRLLNPMEKIGLVQKEENARDARVSLVALSGAGKRVFEEATIAFDHASKALLSPVDANKQRTLWKVLEALL